MSLMLQNVLKVALPTSMLQGTGCLIANLFTTNHVQKLKVTVDNRFSVTAVLPSAEVTNLTQMKITAVECLHISLKQRS